MERDSAVKLLSHSNLTCCNCGKVFFRRCNLIQHEKAGRCKSKGDELKCPECSASFGRSDSLRRHLVTVHKVSIKQIFACGICKAVFRSRQDVGEHRKIAHTAHSNFDLVESAFWRQTQLLRCFIPEELSTNMESTFKYAFKQLVQLVDDMRAEFKYFKMGTVLHMEMARYDEQGLLTKLKVFPFRALSAGFSRVSTKTQVVTSITKVVGDYERAKKEFLHMGSGWTVTRGMFLEVEVSHCLPLSGFTAKDCTLHIEKYNAKAKAVTAQNFTDRPLPTEHSLYLEEKARVPGLLKSEVPLASMKAAIPLKAGFVCLSSPAASSRRACGRDSSTPAAAAISSLFRRARCQRWPSAWWPGY